MCIDGLNTLEGRMKAVSANALEIAGALEQRGVPTIYLGLESHPQYELGQRQHSGNGGIVAFDLGDMESALAFLRQSQIPIVANLGLPYHALSHPASTTHSRMSPEARLQAGVTDGFVRLSVGTEPTYKVLRAIESVLR